MNWFNVLRGVPPKGEWVLCKFKENSITGYVVQSWEPFTNKDDKWFIETFSHWCYIIEPHKYH